jgi:hypothetical protein
VLSYDLNLNLLFHENPRLIPLVSEVFSEQQIDNLLIISSIMSLEDALEALRLANTDSLDDLDDPFEPTTDKQREIGLLDAEKKLLLQCVDAKGGLRNCTRESKVVELICDKKKKVFGFKGSQKRRATQNVITKWKAHATKGTFDQIRIQLGVPKPSKASDSLAATATLSATSAPSFSPPKTIRATMPPSSVASSKMTSPQKLLRKKKALPKDDGMSTAFFFALLLILFCLTLLL